MVFRLQTILLAFAVLTSRWAEARPLGDEDVNSAKAEAQDFAIGFDLSHSSATSAIVYHNGSSEDLAIIHTSMAYRRLLASWEPQYTWHASHPKQVRLPGEEPGTTSSRGLSARKVHFGRQYQVNLISAVMSDLKRQSESILGRRIHDAVVSVPIPLQQRPDIFSSALTRSRIHSPLPKQNLLSNAAAAVSGARVGICSKHTPDRRRKCYPSASKASDAFARVLVIEYSRDVLSSSVAALNPLNTSDLTSAPWSHFANHHLSAAAATSAVRAATMQAQTTSARPDSQRTRAGVLGTYWSSVSTHIVQFLRSQYPVTDVVLVGEAAAANQHLEKAIEEALVTSGSPKGTFEIHDVGNEAASFLSARGAANVASSMGLGERQGEREDKEFATKENRDEEVMEQQISDEDLEQQEKEIEVGMEQGRSSLELK